jgi:hypothetical protein
MQTLLILLVVEILLDLTHLRQLCQLQGNLLLKKNYKTTFVLELLQLQFNLTKITSERGSQISQMQPAEIKQLWIHLPDKKYFILVELHLHKLHTSKI